MKILLQIAALALVLTAKAQGSSEAIYQVGGPRRAVLIFDFIDQDVRHNPR